MNPIVIIAAVGGLAALLLGGKKSAPKSITVATLPTPAGTITVQKAPSTTTAPSVPAPTPPITITLPTLPTDQDYPTMPASGNLDPMLDQSEQYELANYTNDQLYNDAMSSGHLAFVAAAATKLASSGDTRAADLTLRVANWGK